MNQRFLIAVLVVVVVVLTGTTTYFATLQKQAVVPNQPVVVEKNNITVPKTDPGAITEQDMKDLYVQLTKEQPAYVSQAGKDYTFNVVAKNGRYIDAMLTSASKELFSRPGFLAYKADDGWKIGFYGQELPECGIVNKYNFPKDVVDECYDVASNKSVQR